MLSRLLLSALVVLVLATVVTRLAGASDLGCGPVTGTVISGSTSAALLPADEARAAALVAVPGAAVIDLDLDDEDGYLVYEIELVRERREIDVVVDAGTGDILCTDRD